MLRIISNIGTLKKAKGIFMHKKQIFDFLHTFKVAPDKMYMVQISPPARNG